MGSIIGWLIRDSGELIAVDAVVGALGAVPAAWFLGPLAANAAAESGLGVVDIVAAAFGAIFLISVWIACRRNRK